MVAHKAFRHTRTALAYHSIGYFLNRGFPFLAVFAAARVLGAADFGRFIGAISLFSTLLLLVDLGLSLAVTTRIAARAQDGVQALRQCLRAAVSATVTLGGLIALGIAAFAQPLSRLMFDGAGSMQLALAGAIYVPFAALALVIGGALQGLQRYREQAAIGAVFGVMHVVVVVTLAALFGATAAVWGAAATMAVRAGMNLFVVRDLLWWPSECGSIRAELPQLMTISAPACLAALAMAPAGTLVVAALFRHPNGATEVGSFGVALQIFAFAMVVPGILTQFALPRMARLNDARAMQKTGVLTAGTARTLALQYASIATASAVLIAGPVIIMAPFILSLFGETYVAYAFELRLMMAAAIVAAPQGIFSNFLLADGKNWLRVATMYAWPVIVVSLTLGKAPSATDAAGAYLAAWVGLTLLQAWGVAFSGGHRAGA